MIDSGSMAFSKYPGDGQPTYNGGSFMSNDQASVVGCAGTSCKTLAANSVFSDPIDQGQTLAPATANATASLSGGKRTKRKSVKKGKKSMKGGKSRKAKKSMKGKKSMKKGKKSMKGGKWSKGGKKSMKKGKRSMKGKKGGKWGKTMKGGGSRTQMMSNICHSSGYSIGPMNTELKPTEVGLAAGHFAPYTRN